MITTQEKNLPIPSAPDILGSKLKLLYGTGEISNSIKAFAFGLFLLFFYTSVMGLPGTWVGLASSIGLIWDALIDPFIGHLSDRSRSRFGRRHSFMIIGALVMGISFFAIFSPPAGLSNTALFAWLIVTSIILRTSNSVFMVPYHALGAELSQDYHERTSVTSYRAALALFGTLIAAVSSFIVFFPEKTPGIDPKFNPPGYLAMGLVFGLVIALTGFLATFGTRIHATPPPDVHEKNEDNLSFWDSLKFSLSNRTFLILTISAGIFFLGSVINATVAVHYLTYYAGITESRALSIFLLSFYVGALAGVPIWLRVARKTDKKQLYFGTTIVVALIMLASYFFIGEGHLFGTGTLLPLLGGNAAAGFFGSALWILPASMIADVVDQDERITSRRREGAYFGVHSFFNQESASLAVLFSGILVDRFAGLIPGQVEQSAETINRLGLVFGPLPAVLLILAAFLILGYGLNHEQVMTLQKELASRHT